MCWSSDLASCATFRAPIDAAGYVSGVAAAVHRGAVDLVLPGDDPALWLLHRMHADPALEEAAPAVLRVLDRSLAPCQHHEVLERRSQLVALARELGVATAPTCVDPSPAEAQRFAEAHGWPVVLKLDYTWGGTGVRMACSAGELRDLLAWAPELPSVGRRARVLEAFAPGASYVVAYAALRGKLLGCAPLEKVRVARGGASAVLRPMGEEHRAQAVGAVERLVGSLGLSGLGDVELRVAPSGTAAWLLELNPRVVPGVRAARPLGIDLCAVLREAVQAERDGTQVSLASQPAEIHVEHREVAVFPTEWLRDPSSPYLTQAYHDVPWGDPRLLAEVVRRLAPQAGAMQAGDAAWFEEGAAVTSGQEA